MTVKAKAEITLSRIIDIDHVTRYYILQSSTASVPSKPTTNPPGGSWSITEPSYTSGSTNSLYFVDLTVMTNGSFGYSAISKSSSYEAAKEAWNKANNAQKAIDDLDVGGRNYFSNKSQTAFDEDNEYQLPSYQDTGSFKQFYNMIVPMSYFVGKTCRLSFDVISPNGSTPINVYNSNGKPRYLMTASGIKSPISDSWTHQELSITVSDMGDSTDYTESNSNKIEIYCPAQTGCKVRNVKFEIGNKATDWTPAIEDMATVEALETTNTAMNELADQVDTRITATETDIDTVNQTISNLIVDENGGSLMKQTTDGWVFSMAETMAQIQQATDDLKTLENNLDDQGGSIDALQNTVNTLETLTSYVRITTEGDEPCIELGNNRSFKVRITNTSIDFVDGTSIPAYINNQSLKIDKAEVENELAFGGFAFKERSNGNMGLIWKG